MGWMQQHLKKPREKTKDGRDENDAFHYGNNNINEEIQEEFSECTNYGTS